MSTNKFVRNIDYGDDVNRSFKVEIDCIIAGYSFDRLTKWVNNWTDPAQSIRNSPRYRQLYLENYKNLREYIPKRCVTKLHAERRDKQNVIDIARAKFLVDGLQDCIVMFQKIKENMAPTDEHYKSFVWETKVLFFSFYDLCKQKQK